MACDERHKILTTPLPNILDELAEAIRRVEEAQRLAQEAAAQAKEALVEARQAGVKTAEQTRVLAESMARIERIALDGKETAELVGKALMEGSDVALRRLASKFELKPKK